MTTNNRQQDELVEKITNEFEDQYFWPKLLKDKLSCMVRYDDPEHQWAGIDYTISGYAFDEKVKYHGNLNKIIPYPSFEITFVNRAGNVQNGWLLDESNKAEWHTITCLSATTNDESCLSSSHQILACDILIVKKQDIFDYIGKWVQPFQLLQDAHHLRELADRGYSDVFGNKIVDKRGIARHQYDNGRKFCLSYSTQLKEKPVNLVFGRKTLEELPHSKHFIVTKEEVRKA